MASVEAPTNPPVANSWVAAAMITSRRSSADMRLARASRERLAGFAAGVIGVT
jgi:hypothetical protein